MMFLTPGSGNGPGCCAPAPCGCPCAMGKLQLYGKGIVDRVIGRSGDRVIGNIGFESESRFAPSYVRVAVGVEVRGTTDHRITRSPDHPISEDASVLDKSGDSIRPGAERRRQQAP